MSFVGEKNRTYLVDMVSFIALEVLSFHGRGKMFIYMSNARLLGSSCLGGLSLLEEGVLWETK